MKYLTLIIFLLISCEKENKNIIEFCSQKLLKDTKCIICIDKKNINIRPLLKFKNLEALDLSGSNLNNYKDLSKIKTVKYLNLNGTNIKGSEFLSPLENIEELYIGDTEINSLNFIKKWKKLRNLHINSSKIDDLSILKKYKKRCDMEFNIKDLKIKKDHIIDVFFSKIIKYKNKLYSNHPKLIWDQIKKFKKIKVVDISCNDRKIFHAIPYPEFYLSLITHYNSEKKDLNLIYLDNRMVFLPDSIETFYNHNSYKFYQFVNLSSLKRLKYIESLKISVKNKKIIDLFYLKNLKKVLIYGDVKKVISKSLEQLTLFNIDENIDLEILNLKKMDIITKDIHNEKWKIIKKKYPKIDINIEDFHFFNLNNNDYYKTKVYITNQDNRSSTFVNEFRKFNLKKDLSFSSYTKLEFFNIIKEDIKNNDLLDIIDITNSNVLKYLLKNYPFTINKIDEKSEKTVLDYAYELKNKEIIKLLRKYGAKRGCELLNKKCDMF